MSKKSIFNYLWITPAFLLLTLLMLSPLIRTIWLSFQWKPLGVAARYIGLQNFLDVVQRGIFFPALLKTLIFTVPAVSLKLLIGMVSAIFLNTSFPGRNAIRSWLFIPWTIPAFAGSILFLWILRMGGGLNIVLSKFGIDPIFWLGPRLAMMSVVFLNVWKGFPFFTVGILAGLQSIPKELYEVASIDGASALKKYIYITLPSIKNVILIITILSAIWNLAEFENIFVLTEGGPGNATEVLSLSVYNHAFRRYNFPLSSATAVLTLPVFFFLIYWLMKLLSKETK